MAGRLAGKCAVVTGASSGIGRAVARAFAAEGARVALVARRTDVLEGIVAELDGSHLAIATDVTDEAQVAAAFARVRIEFGRLDAQFNCAGIQLVDVDAPVDRLDLATWHRTLDVNLTGTFLTCKYGVRLMLDSGAGSMINCGSPTGLTGRGWRYAAYSTSKGGIFALTKTMAVAYGSRGIRVNCVVPGTIATAMTERVFLDEERTDELTQRTALKRIGTPEDLQGVCVFLASDESAYVTGAIYAVDGGLMIT